MARGRHAAFAHRTLGLDKAATTQTRYEDVADHQDLYLEEEISVPDFFRTHRPTVQGLRDYFQDLFPFWNWIFHYNITWLVGDMIAGKRQPAA